eukprot:Phypoly_transcript_23506.p1 GENE.Phypoly_transcript_23506~~Phypoly_transcript_23506.p1  ORF type:complete len:179 (+),score=2.73 Phypoly_transcript_23506:25-537(+)
MTPMFVLLCLFIVKAYALDCEHSNCTSCIYAQNDCSWCLDSEGEWKCQDYSRSCVHPVYTCADCSAFVNITLCETNGCMWCNLAQKCSSDEAFCFDDLSSSDEGYLPSYVYVLFALAAGMVIAGVIIGILFIKRKMQTKNSYEVPFESKQPLISAINDGGDDEENSVSNP